jgi:hypothetical protein
MYKLVADRAIMLINSEDYNEITIFITELYVKSRSSFVTLYVKNQK